MAHVRHQPMPNLGQPGMFCGSACLIWADSLLSLHFLIGVVRSHGGSCLLRRAHRMRLTTHAVMSSDGVPMC